MYQTMEKACINQQAANNTDGALGYLDLIDLFRGNTLTHASIVVHSRSVDCSCLANDGLCDHEVAFIDQEDLRDGSFSCRQNVKMKGSYDHADACGACASRTSSSLILCIDPHARFGSQHLEQI
jgi:hypothetical protein